VKQAHVSTMTDLPFKLSVLVAALAATLAVGCTSTGTTGDGNTPRTSRGGGWENFRAEAPVVKPGLAG
jgi:type IV pilus biogenesis protein CpaD/CtpE